LQHLPRKKTGTREPRCQPPSYTARLAETIFLLWHPLWYITGANNRYAYPFQKRGHRMKRSLITVSLASLAFILPAGFYSFSNPPDFAGLPQGFHFKPAEASLAYSIGQYKGNAVLKVERLQFPGDAKLRFSCENRETLVLSAHEGTVFRASGNTLYFAAFQSCSAGCTVIAYDLNDGKTIWSTHLKSAQCFMHFAYCNRVTLDLSSDAVTVTGSESYGDYVEVLDRRTGKSIAHRIYRQGF
jgi:hypothetical protein